MAQDRIKSTRSELLKLRKRVKLAKKGHELLKKKQDSLVIEFFKLLKDVKAERERLQAHYQKALLRMSEARSLESDVSIRAASLAVRASAPIKVDIRNIAGVKIPEITLHQGEKTVSAYSSIMLQDVGAAYQHVIDDILQLAAKETALRKLLLEIKKVKRRAHALEHVLLPQLKAAAKRIQFDLEERAREEFSRLKRRKK
jgi:V/A-type H+-transporting ATPase subunit D